MQHYRMRYILAEKSYEPFINFDKREASRFGKCSRDGTDPRPNL